MEEEWRPVKGYEGMYSVSNMGRVRSEDRKVRGRWGWRECRGIELTPTATDTGYIISLSRDGKERLRTLGSVVAGSFLDGHDPNRGVWHLNGDPFDNRAVNLFQRGKAAEERELSPGRAQLIPLDTYAFLLAGSKLGIPVEALEELYATHSLT